MARYSIEFVKYLAGLRGASTSLTCAETGLLRKLAAAKSCVVEVGVFEGATSRAMAEVVREDGRLYLVDPQFYATRMEKWLGFSASGYIAGRSVKRFGRKVRFVRMTSLQAARELELHQPADLIFIDADHSYEAVKADFEAWATHLASGGAIAVHDSRVCEQRPDLTPETGPVRYIDELRTGHLCPWQVSEVADSLSVLRRA